MPIEETLRSSRRKLHSFHVTLGVKMTFAVLVGGQYFG